MYKKNDNQAFCFPLSFLNIRRSVGFQNGDHVLPGDFMTHSDLKAELFKGIAQSCRIDLVALASDAQVVKNEANSMSRATQCLLCFIGRGLKQKITNTIACI